MEFPRNALSGTPFCSRLFYDEKGDTYFLQARPHDCLSSEREYFELPTGRYAWCSVCCRVLKIFTPRPYVEYCLSPGQTEGNDMAFPESDIPGVLAWCKEHGYPVWLDWTDRPHEVYPTGTSMDDFDYRKHALECKACKARYSEHIEGLKTDLQKARSDADRYFGALEVLLCSILLVGTGGERLATQEVLSSAMYKARNLLQERGETNPLFESVGTPDLARELAKRIVTGR